MHRPCTHLLAVAGVSLVLTAGAIAGQTVITPPSNKYTPAQDVELGRKAAAEVDQKLPMLRDEDVTSLVTSIGRRLVESIPQALQHPEFRYTFQIVGVREINAFALPGGPMYINRGMIEAARSEGEVAGVMAHELAHVVLRHGTAQATKATKYQAGTLLGAIVGSIIGGNAGSAVAQGTQFGLGTAFLRFSREFERQADLLGSHIMAASGYDPLDMASLFQTIEKQGGSGGPQWLSDHPNPGDRQEAITREAKLLPVLVTTRETHAFAQAQARLRRMDPAPTTEEATRTASGRRGTSPVPNGRPSTAPSRRVAAPSTATTSYNEGDLFRVSVPSNWRERPGNDTVTFAPDGAYGQEGDERSFTHGMEIGVARNETHDLRTATDELVAAFARSNPGLGRPDAYGRTRIGGRDGLRTSVSNGSAASRSEERLAIFTMLLDDGSLFYALGVAPLDRFQAYDATFRKVVGSIEILR